MSHAPEMTGQEIRALAEALNATRDKALHLVRLPSGKFDVLDDDEVGENHVILTCKTAADVADRTVVHTLTGTVGKNVDSPRFPVNFFKDHNYDAFFLSEPAVEKFVLPYYSRIGKPSDLELLLKKYNVASVFAVAHLPKSIPEVIGEQLERKADRRPLHVLIPTTGAVDSAEFLSLQEFVRRFR
ncbi:MAG TPA: hypothetical protein VE913_19090 [Longimicrobium sp.]|nr:hypothetical protein [Longimicrobium sp.]